MSWKLGLQFPLNNQDIQGTVTVGVGGGGRLWIRERLENPGSATGKAVAHILGCPWAGSFLLPRMSRFLQPPGSTELLWLSDGF